MEIDRACGVPENSSEAGPSSPGAILKPMSFLILIGGLGSTLGFYLLSPSSDSPTATHLREEMDRK